MSELPARYLEPCPKCQGQMVFKDSDEFEGAVNLRCTKCWLRYDCNENHRATAAKLWNASQPQVSDDTVRVPRAELERIASCKIIAAQHPEHGPVICWSFDVNEAARKLLTAAPASEPQALSEGLVTLAECPPGMFIFNGHLGLKTEYGMSEVDENGANMPGSQVRWIVGTKPDAYVAASGECFWGGAKSHNERAALLVRPVDAEALARFATETQKGSGE